MESQADTHALLTASHLHTLCGARVTINVPMQWIEVRYPTLSETLVSRETYSSAQPVPEDFFAASVIPEQALLVTLLVLEGGTTFVDPHRRQGEIFLARPRFCLRGVVPDDSVVHAFVYQDHHGQTKLGLFDANKVGGEDVAGLGPLERHCRIFELYHAAVGIGAVPEHILYHGVFYEHACLDIDSRTLPFPASSLMRLPQTSSDLACERLLLSA